MKILYLSCHSILEHDEIKMLSSLGHEVFPAGAYINPAIPHDDMRPPIPGLTVDPELLAQYGAIDVPTGVDTRDHLTREFCDNFDMVMVMHIPKWIRNNWGAFENTRVVWRTIGQSVASTEVSLNEFRPKGLEVIRYSPMERNIPGFIGEDALIRFYKDPADYGGWTGEQRRVITFAQHMKDRDAACNFSFFEEVTRDFPRHLFGPGNDHIGEWTSGKVSAEQQLVEYQTNRAYFYTGTHPASYTLNFMEAWMCFPGETLVASDTPIEDVLVKNFNGELIDIETACGIVSCTPTHPFLTQRGFVKAEDLGILDSIYQYQEAICDGTEVDQRRIDDIVQEFSEANKSVTGIASESELLGDHDEVQDIRSKKTKLDYFQTAPVFYDSLRDLLFSWNHRRRGNTFVQGEQEAQQTCSNSPDPEYRLDTDQLARGEVGYNKSGGLRKIVTTTKESIQLLVEGLEDTLSTRGIRALSLDQKRALWNFDWFHQEQADAEVQSRLLAIRNRFLNQDPNVKSTRILQINRRRFQGPVYNLSTADGIYQAEGFLVHNTGIPIVAIGSDKGNSGHFPGHNLYEVPHLIENGVTGFVSNSHEELHSYIKELLDNKDAACQISEAARKKAIEIFGRSTIAEAWGKYLA